MSVEDQVEPAIRRVPSMDEAQLKATKQNAIAKGEPAAALVSAIDQRLSVIQAPSGMAGHRMVFALLERRKDGHRSRDKAPS